MLDQTLINHVVLAIDASSSMSDLRDTTIQVADGLVEHLAQQSKALDQETRVSIYTFNTRVECVVYDKDVLRLPSLKGAYRTSGMTALCAATLRAIEDLEKTATLYGDHAFLVYVLTDGEENSSSVQAKDDMRRELARRPDNWTLATLVPDEHGRNEAIRFGFPRDNTQIWSTTEAGVVEVGRVVRQATDAYMQNRALGIRGTKNLFNLDTSGIKPSTLKSMLTKLTPDQYQLFWVDHLTEIRPFVERATGRIYKKGMAYYQLTKAEDIQAGKDVIVRDPQSGLYAGKDARDLIGLPDYTARVHPDKHSKYTIFVQSTSVNRTLQPGTQVLVRP